jgi:Zn finger protein HypA/HybF involved in hydrogenase expression
LFGAFEVNFEELAEARWICLACDCQRLGDDFLIASSPQETVAVGGFEETTTKHVYDLAEQELDEPRLRCPNCGSATLRIDKQDTPP